MTKPADGTPKARELAIEICAYFVTGDPLLYCPGKVAEIAAKITSERKEAREECFWLVQQFSVANTDERHLRNAIATAIKNLGER